MQWLRAGFLPVSTMILLVAAFVVPLPLYVQQPGTVVPLSACVTFEDAESTPVRGDYLLTTISVLEATVADVVIAAFDGDASLTSRGSVVPTGVHPDEFFQQQRQLFDTTADVAAAVGLDAAGKPATVSGDGVLLLQIADGSPAAAVLEPGDLIVALDGTPIGTDVELRQAILSTPVGKPMRVEVTRGDEVVTVDVAAVDVDGVPQIGVVPQTVNQRVTLPVDVDVLSGTIGGPSAGLMVALTVYDKILPDVDLAGGRMIAGTGTIDASGHVGPIGGVEMKVLAAHRRDADVFLAPAGTEEAARAAVPRGSDLQVVPVATFEDARRALLDTAPENPPGRAPAEGACPYAEGA